MVYNRRMYVSHHKPAALGYSSHGIDAIHTTPRTPCPALALTLAALTPLCVGLLAYVVAVPR